MPRSPNVGLDYVYPLHFLDQTEGNRIHVHWLVHYDDVLDAQKLHDGLWRLLQIGDWKKLGGRLRPRGKGRLEIHVPRQYSAIRPPFLYSHDRFDMRIAEHKLARSFVHHSSQPSAHSLSPDLKSFMMAPSTPKKFKCWVNRDIPMLSIRITSFADATLVGITWAHPLMDGLGARAMLQGWSLVVAGKENQLPPVYGAHEDVLLQALHNHYKLGTPEDLALESRRLRGVGLVHLLLRFGWTFATKSENQAKRVVIPKAAFERIKARAQEEIAQTTSEKPFLSDYVLLTSWFASIMSASGRPSVSAAPMNARFRIPEVRQDGVYIQNMVVPLYTFLPREVARGGVGQIALYQQAQLKAQATSEQVLATLSAKSYTFMKNKNEFLSLLFGDGGATYMGFNDLAKIGALQVANFESAVVGLTTDEKHEPRRGQPVRFSNWLHQDIVLSFALTLSKDAQGAYSFMVSMTPKEYAILDKELEMLSANVSSKIDEKVPSAFSILSLV